MALMLGSLLMSANWPVTVFAIMPTNNRLMALQPGMASADIRAMIGALGCAPCVQDGAGLCCGPGIHLGFADLRWPAWAI